VEKETLEDKVLSRKKGNSRVIFYIIVGLLLLGIVSLFGGVKLLSRFSVSADTDTPPIPGEPTVEASSTVTITTSTSSTPTVPPDPGGTTTTITVPAGWSMIPGSYLAAHDVSPISKSGIYLYSFNDPSPLLNNNDWVISNPENTEQSDCFKISATQCLYPYESLGYWMYNPGNPTTVQLGAVVSTRPNDKLVFGHGWHLLYWPYDAASKNQLLTQTKINYSGSSTAIGLDSASSQQEHKVSIKVYVVVNQGNLTSSSVKELTGTDSSTTISKIPANSFYWVYLRRTKNRAIDLGVTAASTTSSTPTPTVIPSTTSTWDGPPMPSVN